MNSRFKMVLKLIAVLSGLMAIATINRAARGHVGLSPAEPISVTNGNSYADNDSIILWETFESGIGGWTTSDLTNPGPSWHHDTYNGFSGPSWWSGKTSLMGYENNWLQYLVSPTINLSSATYPVLNCMVYWAVEPPSTFGQYDGWDGCNVWVSVTNGNTWQVLTPTSPAYNCQHLYSFGWRWNMGINIPGWAGFSGGWTPASFDLSNYTVANVMIRFAFASDEANCTVGNPSYLGFFVDNIEVREGTSVYLSNTASGTPLPAEFTTSTGTPSGNYWVYNEDRYHSPNHSWNCDDLYFLSDALTSPMISIPGNMSTRMRYWVYCDMPDFDGDSDNYLDDYYYIEVAPAGSAFWTPIVYDWAHNGSQLQWVERFNGYWDDLPTPEINLTPWAGQNVQIRFRVVTDGNNDGGEGEGLYIDDVLLLSSSLPNNDVGATQMIIPFPTYLGRNNIPSSVDLINYGILNQSLVPAFWTYGGQPTALIPWTQINAADTVTRTFTWTPPALGFYDFSAYTTLTADENRSNDTCSAGLVEVTPAGTFELGYDHRQITYLPDFYNFNFSQGAGALVLFTPAEDGIPGDLYGDYLKAMFYSTGTIRMHILASAAGGVPGIEVFQSDIVVDTNHVYPNWAEFDLGSVQYLQGGHPDFWVWLEVTSNDSKPHLTGHLIDSFSEGHFFTYNGTTANSTIVNFNIRAVLTGTVGVKQEAPKFIPQQTALLPNFPNPFNSSTTIGYQLATAGQVTLSIFDLSGRRIQLLDQGLVKAGQHSVRYNAGYMASGIYICKLETETVTLQKKIVLLK
ncbi:MAG: T9SS type A sorting domain-containing protein [bacterium]|nr:T9SS type A sorting domain-containing protein [bacterium]